MHKRICEQTDLTGFFDFAGYRMPGCSMFHRSARIDRPAKSDRMEISANSSAARTARHGRNRHSSGIFTFFSLEEGSNFVQNIRHNRTSSTRWAVSFLFTLPAASHIPPHSLRPHQTIERTHEHYVHFYMTMAVPATFFSDRQGKKQLKVVSAGQTCNRKRFLTWFQFFPFGEMRTSKLNSRYTPMKIKILCNGYCACRKGTVQGVSERLVSEGGAFYSRLAQEGQGLVFWRLFLLEWWDLLSAFVVLIYCFVIITQQNVKEQMKGWHKNHDRKTSLCDMPGRPFVSLRKASFRACPASKAICSMIGIR